MNRAHGTLMRYALPSGLVAHRRSSIFIHLRHLTCARGVKHSSLMPQSATACNERRGGESKRAPGRAPPFSECALKSKCVKPYGNGASAYGTEGRSGATCWLASSAALANSFPLRSGRKRACDERSSWRDKPPFGRNRMTRL